jgi:hypothetical protein
MLVLMIWKATRLSSACRHIPLLLHNQLDKKRGITAVYLNTIGRIMMSMFASEGHEAFCVACSGTENFQQFVGYQQRLVASVPSSLGDRYSGFFSLSYPAYELHNEHLE